MKAKIYIVVLAAILLQMTSCVKEIVENNTIDIHTLPPQEVITTSFYGQLKDIDGNAIAGAVITLQNAFVGTVKRTTDESGNFQFLDEQVKGNYANLHVLAAGMWDINKTILVLKEKTSRVDLVCQAKTISKTFSSGDSPKILLENGLEIYFSAGSIGTSTGDEYEGSINVSARSIIKGQEFYEKMSPGSGWGLNNDNEVTRVVPMVTLDLELTDEDGNALQMKEDKAAIVRLPLPIGTDIDALESSVMHFEESLFAWDENTNYTIDGDFLEVEIPHFSTWSWCQIIALRTSVYGVIEPTMSINTFDALHYVTFVYEPISFKVATATDGSFYMPFAMGTLPFTMIVQNECEDVVHSQDFPAIDVDIEFDIGTISVASEALTYSTLTVDVINCDSTWVTNGYATLSFDGLEYKRKEVIPILNGSFDYSFLNCESELTGTLFMLDEDNLMTTEPIEINLNNGDVALGSVILCDTFKSFMEIIIDGNQIIHNHKMTWGCTTNGGGQQITGLKDLASFQTNGYWSGPGEYIVGYGSFIDVENNLEYKVDGGMTYTILEFEPNEDDPTNECWRPKVLIGTMSGTAQEFDYGTGAYLKDVTVSGEFEYL
ncbi:carboxypeptidase-like regulatory domain-containing protein [Saprospiraceae bacterium]|nr:carboxypeptidase-like regulatory domain-containing protein [Saprospiraceae bacterium]